MEALYDPDRESNEAYIQYLKSIVKTVNEDDELELGGVAYSVPASQINEKQNPEDPNINPSIVCSDDTCEKCRDI